MLTLALPQRITQAEAQHVADGLLAVAQTQSAPMVLDASALKEFDSSALAVILACQRAAAQRGAVLQVQGLPPRAQRLAQVYGVAAVLGGSP